MTWEIDIGIPTTIAIHGTETPSGMKVNVLRDKLETYIGKLARSQGTGFGFSNFQIQFDNEGEAIDAKRKAVLLLSLNYIGTDATFTKARRNHTAYIVVKQLEDNEETNFDNQNKK